MSFILTFDTEDWYHANFENIPKKQYDGKSNFRNNVDKLLWLCRQHQCKATFFILGCIGENYRDMVEQISKEGHEVASHGYSHELAYRQSKDEFREDVKRSVGILEDITGKRVYGYRAPSWSIVEKNLHYLEVLKELGLKYDASIFPTKNFLYGIPHADRKIHKPVVDGRELDLYEIPTSVFEFMGRGYGYSGGFYFRFFPKSFIDAVFGAQSKRKQMVQLYLHPREIDKTEQKLELPPVASFIHYFNVGGTLKKLDYFMKKYPFVSIRTHLESEFGVVFDG